MPDGKHNMNVQAQEQGLEDVATITLQALLNTSREQTKLVHNATTDLPNDPGDTNIPKEIPKEEPQNVYQFYKISATPSQSSLAKNSPVIPTIGRELSQAI